MQFLLMESISLSISFIQDFDLMASWNFRSNLSFLVYKTLAIFMNLFYFFHGKFLEQKDFLSCKFSLDHSPIGSISIRYSWWISMLEASCLITSFVWTCSFCEYCGVGFWTFYLCIGPLLCCLWSGRNVGSWCWCNGVEPPPSNIDDVAPMRMVDSSQVTYAKVQLLATCWSKQTSHDVNIFLVVKL